MVTAIEKPRSHYLTLSYRWHPESYLKLTKSRIDDFQSRIRLSELPLTMQEAVQVTRQLDVRYLWIDSLCILQDDDDRSDWLYESIRMAETYSNALLNLSASGAADSTKSIFHGRDLDEVLPSVLDLEIGGRTQQYFVFHVGMWNDEVNKSHLLERGWVFQERLFAQRVLHFGQQQLAWECRELDAMEVFPKGFRANTYNLLSKQKQGLLWRATDREASPETKWKSYGLWREMVQHYSTCCFTDPGDRLVALSGIAKCVRQTNADEYLAGMWRLTMAFDLPWWRQSHDRELLPGPDPRYSAPTWSWASVQGEINFPAMSGKKFNRFVEVRATSFRYRDTTNTTGGLTDGSITLACNLHSIFFVNLESGTDFTSLTLNGNRFVIPTTRRIHFLQCEIAIDDLKQLNGQYKLHCTLCYETEEEIWGILLEFDDLDNSYRRVGTLVIDDLEDLAMESDEQEGEELLREERKTSIELSINDGKGTELGNEPKNSTSVVGIQDVQAIRFQPFRDFVHALKSTSVESSGREANASTDSFQVIKVK